MIRRVRRLELLALLVRLGGLARVVGPGRSAASAQGSFQVQSSISVVNPGPNARISPVACWRG
jgi:hypothetical protein